MVTITVNFRISSVRVSVSAVMSEEDVIIAMVANYWLEFLACHAHSILLVCNVVVL